MNEGGRYAAMWREEDGARQNSLARIRECAALTKPFVLPPEGQSEDAKLPEAFTSLGTIGVTTVEGKLTSSLFSPGWFKLDLSPVIEFAPEDRVPAAQKQTEKQNLFLRELQIQATLESAGVMTGGRRRVAGFRTNKRAAISQCLITGDTLERMLPDYRLQVYRRDQYVTLRDSAGDVIHHGIKERVDPYTLEPKQFEKAKLKKHEFDGKSAKDRMVDLYTFTEWQPLTKKWKVCQEVNGEEITEYDETYSQFFSTPFELAPGFNYGRGWVELNLAALRTLNELEMRILDFAAIASDLKWFLDQSSNIKNDDLRQRPGHIIRRARVSGGQVQDAAIMRADKLSDFNVVFQTRESVARTLGRAMLLQTESAPTGEAGRSPVAWNRIADELEGGLGGFYASIHDNQHIPLLERTIYQMVRDKLMPPFPEGAVKYSVVTGLSAIERDKQQQYALSFVEIVSRLGPAAMEALNMDVLIDVFARYARFAEPGAIKTPDQRAAERQAAIDQQAAMELNKAGAQALGGAAQTAAAAAMQNGTPQ